MWGRGATTKNIAATEKPPHGEHAGRGHSEGALRSFYRSKRLRSGNSLGTSLRQGSRVSSNECAAPCEPDSPMFRRTHLPWSVAQICHPTLHRQEASCSAACCLLTANEGTQKSAVMFTTLNNSDV